MLLPLSMGYGATALRMAARFIAPLITVIAGSSPAFVAVSE
jgi:hypothetical protein